MDLSSNIKDGLDGWDCDPEQFMPLSTASPLWINNPSPLLQTKSPPYSDSHPQSHMIPNPDLFGFDSHGIFSPALEHCHVEGYGPVLMTEAFDFRDLLNGAIEVFRDEANRKG